jgi:hypothetical protein
MKKTLSAALLALCACAASASAEEAAPVAAKMHVKTCKGYVSSAASADVGGETVVTDVRTDTACGSGDRVSIREVEIGGLKVQLASTEERDAETGAATVCHGYISKVLVKDGRTEISTAMACTVIEGVAEDALPADMRLKG